MACGLICLLLQTGSSRAEDFCLESVGVRGGVSANPGRNEFHQAEFFGNWNLPWGWDLGKEWHLQSRLDLSVGWLGDSSQSATVGTLGPTLVLGRAWWPVSLEGGVSPTLSPTTRGVMIRSESAWQTQKRAAMRPKVPQP